MSVLRNPQHEHFATLVAAGANFTAAAKAAGYSEVSAASRGCRVAQLPAVTARIAELSARKVEIAQVSAGISKSYVLETLYENVQRAMQKREIKNLQGVVVGFQYEGNVANRALELIGKELGMFVDRKEINGSVNITSGRLLELSDDQVETIQRLLESAHQRQQLEQSQGDVIDIEPERIEAPQSSEPSTDA